MSKKKKNNRDDDDDRKYECFKCGFRQYYKSQCIKCGVPAVWMDLIDRANVDHQVRPFSQRGKGGFRPKIVLSDAEKARREAMKPFIGCDLDAPDFETLFKENRKKVRPVVTQ